jgi:hypothetical protein
VAPGPNDGNLAAISAGRVRVKRPHIVSSRIATYRGNHLAAIPSMSPARSQRDNAERLGMGGAAPTVNPAVIVDWIGSPGQLDSKRIS